jgi:PTH1 family peptidyl-tRNA hydrolase
VGERIIVGLGNPGPEYAGTLHNVGFMVVERVAGRWGIELAPERNGLRVARGVVADARVWLVEPYRFMNFAGPTLAQLEPEWQIEDLIVVHDDIDLPMGQLRVRHDGGTGGHRGLASIALSFGSSFDRIRIGVGRPPAGVDPAVYVLRPLLPPELKELAAVVERASDAVECLIGNGLEAAMNRFNVRQPSAADQPPKLSAPRRAPCDDTKH